MAFDKTWYLFISQVFYFAGGHSLNHAQNPSCIDIELFGLIQQERMSGHIRLSFYVICFSCVLTLCKEDSLREENIAVYRKPNYLICNTKEVFEFQQSSLLHSYDVKQKLT